MLAIAARPTNFNIKGSKLDADLIISDAGHLARSSIQSSAEKDGDHIDFYLYKHKDVYSKIIAGGDHGIWSLALKALAKINSSVADRIQNDTRYKLREQALSVIGVGTQGIYVTSADTDGSLHSHKQFFDTIEGVEGAVYGQKREISIIDQSGYQMINLIDFISDFDGCPIDEITRRTFKSATNQKD